MKNRSQIAMEYVLILTVALMFLIPGFYLFRNYATESNERIIRVTISDISNQILSKAKKIFYYGPPSKATLRLDFPPQVTNMFVLSENNEYFLGFTILETDDEILYDVDVPLKAGETTPCAGIDYCKSNYCECFPPKYYASGFKLLQVMATTDCPNVNSCIEISLK